MPKKCSNVRSNANNCSFIRFLVIIFSFISLISRIIYCTYATWLTVTTFDCIPCDNITRKSNATSDLFIAHHSSAIFNTFRGLNINSKSESDHNSRSKRSQEFLKFNENFSQFFTNDSLEDITGTNEYFQTLDVALNADHRNEFKENTSDDNEYYDQKVPRNKPSKDSNNENELPSKVSSFFNEQTINQKQIQQNSNPNVISPNSSRDGISDETAYTLSEDILISGHLISDKNLSDEFRSLQNDSYESNDWLTFKEDENSMTLILNQSLFNSTKLDSKRQQKSLFDHQLVNDTSYLSANDMTTVFNVCSEDCRQFLSIEIYEPNIRKLFAILITGVLYLYAFVMFCIFIGSCLSLVDLLIISTFIEGAKLFAGFILVIIDSFNGKDIHFNLIDVKFKVNSGGNGWTADLSYSEYLLDIIIFFLSIILCVRVYKCLDKKPKRMLPIDGLADTRGTYRSNTSNNSLEVIFDHN